MYSLIWVGAGNVWVQWLFGRRTLVISHCCRNQESLWKLFVFWQQRIAIEKNGSFVLFLLCVCVCVWAHYALCAVVKRFQQKTHNGSNFVPKFTINFILTAKQWKSYLHIIHVQTDAKQQPTESAEQHDHSNTNECTSFQQRMTHTHTQTHYIHTKPNTIFNMHWCKFPYVLFCQS